MVINGAALSIGFLISIIVFIVGVLILLHVVPFTATTVAGCVVALAVARMVP